MPTRVGLQPFMSEPQPASEDKPMGVAIDAVSSVSALLCVPKLAAACYVFAHGAPKAAPTVVAQPKFELTNRYRIIGANSVDEDIETKQMSGKSLS